MGETGETEMRRWGGGQWGGGGEGGEELAIGQEWEGKGEAGGWTRRSGVVRGRQDWDNGEETGRGQMGRGRWRGGNLKGEMGRGTTGRG